MMGRVVTIVVAGPQATGRTSLGVALGTSNFGRAAGGARQGVLMIVAFSVTPLGVGEDVADYVADAVRVVRASGLPNRTDAMFTSVEGEWDEVMAVVKDAVEAVAARAPRVSITLKADIRPGVTGGLDSKVASLERHLGAG
jgi:uncharacterized protein (TIGR00106 family)